MRAADDFPEGTWRGCHGDSEEALGAVGNPSGAAAVKPESKLFEVAGEVLTAHRSLMRAEDRLSSEKIRCTRGNTSAAV